MTLALKDAYQIKLVPAFQAADGTRFHDVEEARKFTRDNMLKATISAAVKQNPQFAKLDPELLREFLLMTGKHVGAVMAEPLDVFNPASAAATEVTVTNTVRAGETEEQAAARLRRLVETSRTAPLDNPMPKTQNPDIFQNRHPALKAASPQAPTADYYLGDDDPEPLNRTGLHTLRNIPQVSIVAVPGQTSQVGSLRQPHQPDQSAPDRVRPTALQPIWNAAGFALGAATALISEEAAMACTDAVETEIDRHYAAQLDELGEDDPELAADIAEFQAEELEHRDTARAAGSEQAVGYPLLTAAIRAGCRAAIALSKRL